jgi:predicted Zn finger-like uncharacterized protein
MIIQCPSCAAKYKFDEGKLGDAPSKKVRCPKCKAIIEVKNPSAKTSKAHVIEKEKDDHDRTSIASARRDINEPISPPPTTKVRLDALVGDTYKGMEKDEEESESEIPKNRKLSLALIGGTNPGSIYPIVKAITIIGRGEVDLVIQDVESSRQHAQIEVVGDRIILRDLGSTNGTFVNDEKINTADLDNHSEFRIGTTIFMLIITDLD